MINNKADVKAYTKQESEWRDEIDLNNCINLNEINKDLSDRYYFDIVEDKLWMKQIGRYKLIKPRFDRGSVIVSIYLSNGSITNRSYDKLKRLIKDEPDCGCKSFTKQKSEWREDIDLNNCIQLNEVAVELSGRYYYDYIENKLWMKQTGRYKLIKPRFNNLKLYMADNTRFVTRSLTKLVSLIGFACNK